MKALYKGEKKEVWIISRTGARPDWVDYDFRANYIHWTSEAKHELVASVGGLMMTNVGKKYVNDLGKGNGTFFGKSGDVINLTDGIIVSAKQFAKKYEIIE